MKFVNLLKEIALRELGETTETYSIRLLEKRIYSEYSGKGLIDLVWGFDTPKHQYNVHVFNEYEDLLTVDFSTHETGNKVTNEGNPFRVTATVLKAAERSWELIKEEGGFEQIHGFAFNPIEKQNADRDVTQREKLYRTFIEKQFPGADIVKGVVGYKVYME